MKKAIEIRSSDSKPQQETCDALVLFIPEKDQTSFQVFGAVDKKARGAVSSILKKEHFQGKAGESIIFHTGKLLGAARVILVGVGEKSKFTEETFRRASGIAALAARNAACAHVAYTVPSELNLDRSALVQAIVEGALLGTYRYIKFKTKEEEIQSAKKIEKITVLAGKDGAVQDAISRARMYSEATCFARDLVNEPANNLHPAALAEIATKLGKDKGLTVRVLEAPELQKLGAGAILGVGSGSKIPPRLIELRYESGVKKARKVALVGKGITFDSGGLSLKTAKYMETMKCDMAGAAAVLSAMSCVQDLKPNFDVIGILCAAENMPSGSAVRPGDVLHAMNGKSIEVMNTDAEGRLVLADGLSWAARQKVDEIVDLATLTGACVIGLGPYVAGIMGNNDDLINRIVEAGKRAGEPYWRLPIPDEYDFMVKSDIADIKNLAANSEAGAIQGALFLREFIGGAKWAHLDIAGPAWYEKDFFHIPKNASGFGVRTLLQFLSS